MIATDLKDRKSFRYYPAPLAMDISTEQARVTVAVLRPKGRINMGNVDQLVDEAREVYSSGVRALLIDLSDVASLTSAGLRAIQSIYKLFEEESAPENETPVGVGDSKQGSTCFKLLNPSPELQQVFSLVGLDKYIEIHSDRKQALLAF